MAEPIAPSGSVDERAQRFAHELQARRGQKQAFVAVEFILAVALVFVVVWYGWRTFVQIVSNRLGNRPTQFEQRFASRTKPPQKPAQRQG